MDDSIRGGNKKRATSVGKVERWTFAKRDTASTSGVKITSEAEKVQRLARGNQSRVVMKKLENYSLRKQARKL